MNVPTRAVLLGACVLGACGEGPPRAPGNVTAPIRRTRPSTAEEIKAEVQRLLTRASKVPDAAVFLRLPDDVTRPLRVLLLRVGWPGSDLVGPELARCIEPLVEQTGNLMLAEESLPLLEKAFARDPERGPDFARLTDWIRTQTGRPQVYGTVVDRGSWPVIEDGDGVNARRRSVGLEPIEVAYGRLGSGLERIGDPELTLEIGRMAWEAIQSDCWRHGRNEALDPLALRFAEILREHGWPSSTLVGERAASETFSLASRVCGRPSLAGTCGNHLTAAIRRGDVARGKQAQSLLRLLHRSSRGRQPDGHRGRGLRRRHARVRRGHGQPAAADDRGALA